MLRQVFSVLLIKISLVLLCKLALLLELENRCAQWGVDVDLGHVELAHVNIGSERVSQLLLLQRSIQREEVNFMDEGGLVVLGP